MGRRGKTVDEVEKWTYFGNKFSSGELFDEQSNYRDLPDDSLRYYRIRNLLPTSIERFTTEILPT